MIPGDLFHIISIHHTIIRSAILAKSACHIHPKPHSFGNNYPVNVKNITAAQSTLSPYITGSAPALAPRHIGHSWTLRVVTESEYVRV
ncbi:Uncharacterised protein [Raoultella terrigena]|uniref:Uncharacterized protein n=1 Tax=Raoultella terrigena TaxID=577 RepID=A0A4U9D5U6_RAOTE|nr:Uncharacterised protein [Raoultella terrigena]